MNLTDFLNKHNYLVSFTLVGICMFVMCTIIALFNQAESIKYLRGVINNHKEGFYALSNSIKEIAQRQNDDLKKENRYLEDNLKTYKELEDELKTYKKELEHNLKTYKEIE